LTEPFAPGVSFAYALIADEKGSDCHDHGERVLMAAKVIVTAERFLMAAILIVEDDVFIREIAELMIQDWGHQTLSASDVDEALALLRSPQHIDALFTDIYLKTAVLGGCDLARQAIALRPKLRVLYTTGNSMTDKMKALFVEGAYFLRKPYAQYQLQNSIEELLAV
jgi:DNA-binding NtrC family response regulator